MPSGDLQGLLALLIILIPSAIFHEYAHGWLADRLGDHTARYAGRLTLNPKAHFDLWGTFLLPVMLYIFTNGQLIFGYPKPVPVNPYNLRDQKWGPALVSAVGPLSNLLIAVAVGMVVRVVGLNDGTIFFAYVALVNINLAVFNLLPIPPLDGSKILYAVLPDSAQRIQSFFDRYGIIVLIIFAVFLSNLIFPVVNFLFNLLVG